MYDQVTGGFARYSVDERWHVPHFEKMLYDNAQLASVYTHAMAPDALPRTRAHRARDARVPGAGAAASGRRLPLVAGRRQRGRGGTLRDLVLGRARRHRRDRRRGRARRRARGQLGRRGRPDERPAPPGRGVDRRADRGPGTAGRGPPVTRPAGRRRQGPRPPGTASPSGPSPRRARRSAIRTRWRPRPRARPSSGSTCGTPTAACAGRGATASLSGTGFADDHADVAAGLLALYEVDRRHRLVRCAPATCATRCSPTSTTRSAAASSRRPPARTTSWCGRRSSTTTPSRAGTRPPPRCCSG